MHGSDALSSELESERLKRRVPDMYSCLIVHRFFFFLFLPLRLYSSIIVDTRVGILNRVDASVKVYSENRGGGQARRDADYGRKAKREMRARA